MVGRFEKRYYVSDTLFLHAAHQWRTHYGQTSGRVALGDTIVAVNGKPGVSLDDLAYAFDQVGVGGSATLTVERDGARRNVTVRLVDLQ